MEKHLESKLRERVKQKGGIALKLVCPGTRGATDRFVLMPEKKIRFVETKIRPGVKPTRIQLAFHKMLKKYGFEVDIVNDDQSLNNFINGL